ncbi:MAG: DUF1611 domain-containing protein [Candidatus Eisenbacteria bacterium]|nr:DUF1611 domain-containing protein [Candidatus Eisenbacteria bacterium]
MSGTGGRGGVRGAGRAAGDSAAVGPGGARRPRRFLILADGALGILDAKTAVGALRYLPEEVAAVLDRAHAGRTSGEVLGVPGAAPVVATVAEGLALGANALLVGIAPVGGELPPQWRAWLLEGLAAGMDVWSGLHTFLSDDAQLAAAARRSGARIADLRRVPEMLPVATARAAELLCTVCLTVASDCNSGKMTVALELHRAARRAGMRSRFVATGQTGILLAGSGLAVDRVISDFVAGAAEQLVLEAAEGADVVFVEGQGSLFHPGYSGVTLGLLHGASPGHMVLCHQPTRTATRAGGIRFPGYRGMIEAYEAAAGWVRPARVVAVALNTFDLPGERAREELARARSETGLPAADVVRHGADTLLEALR